MTTVDIRDADRRLTELVEAVECGAESEIVITRNGQPVARLLPVAPQRKVIFGLAKDRWPSMPADPAADDAYIDWLFYGEGSEPK